MRWAIPAGLGAAVLLLGIAMAAFPSFENGRYLQSLETEIAKVQPAATRAGEIDKRIESARAQTLVLDGLRKRSKSDMDVLAELTRLLEAPTWLNSVQITEQRVTLSGQTDQSSGLLKTIDESELFEGSEFTAPPQRSEGLETFRMQIRRTEAQR
jgi:hypothetical protein